MSELYFLKPKYQNRISEQPQKNSKFREVLFQFFATITLMLGFWYIHFRWNNSLNMDALWFSIPLAFAETMMFIGTILVVINLWRVNDTKKKFPPSRIKEVMGKDGENIRNRNIKIDIYIPIFNESPELVEQTIISAKRVKKLKSWDLNIYLLDDSHNEKMTKMVKNQNITQITREGKKGRKAGAITNAINITGGDFIVIIDSDTRLFENILLNTMGYFKDENVAWVQTPQWFCDLTDDDVFANDPAMFFDVLQRRRNNYNASFCCGATSIHRVDALKKVAIDRYEQRIKKLKKEGQNIEDIDVEYIAYHTSEDIYTSILVHSYKKRNYKSVLHPDVESKMLSPLDLITWTAQRFRYAGGTIDLIKKEFSKFLSSGLSLGQKLMYFSTFWSYTGAIWLLILIISPIIFMFTNIAPVTSYSNEFFIHLIPFLFFNQLSLMIATWGINTNRGAKFFVAIFPIVLKAFWDVAKNKPINFVVTSKTAKGGNFLPLVKIQIALIALYLVAIIYSSTLLIIGERIYLTGYAINLLWSIYNISALWAIIKAALYKFES